MNRGSCLCGAVQFEAGPFDSMVHCHCSMCRKHHGAMFATFLSAPPDRLRWLSGEEHVVTYKSSEHGLRPFCRICGSVVPVVLPYLATAFIPAGNLVDDPGLRPELHMFAGSCASWFPITDSLPQYAGLPPVFAEGAVIDNPVPESRLGVTEGRCLCGDIAWELTGEPGLAQNCHCSRCRRARSAAHATNAFFRREQLTWTRGEEGITSYALPGAKRFGQDFCSRCGSPVPRVNASTGFVVVPFGSLDTPPGKGPRGHIFIGSKAPWFEISGDLPQWETLPA